MNSFRSHFQENYCIYFISCIFWDFVKVKKKSFGLNWAHFDLSPNLLSRLILHNLSLIDNNILLQTQVFLENFYGCQDWFNWCCTFLQLSHPIIEVQLISHFISNFDVVDIKDWLIGSLSDIPSTGVTLIGFGIFLFVKKRDLNF